MGMFRWRPVPVVAVLCLALQACAASLPRRPARDAEVGVASYMDPGLAGARTASGVAFDPHRLVAAHRTLPFGSRVTVTNLENGRAVEVTIVDRGPHRRGRIIDLSPRAARALGFIGAGTARVRVEIESLPTEASADPR